MNGKGERINGNLKYSKQFFLENPLKVPLRIDAIFQENSQENCVPRRFGQVFVNKSGTQMCGILGGG
jgi:hypothetical protein